MNRRAKSSSFAGFDQLTRESHQSSSEALADAVAQFNRAEFFACHETLEKLWLADPGPLKNLYQGILLIGVACLHLQRGNVRGTRLCLERGLARLGEAGPMNVGIDLEAFISDAAQLLKTARALAPENLASQGIRYIPTLRFSTTNPNQAAR